MLAAYNRFHLPKKHTTKAFPLLPLKPIFYSPYKSIKNMDYKTLSQGIFFISLIL
jgi:hypothetical protein